MANNNANLSSLDEDHLAEMRQHLWKERLNIWILWKLYVYSNGRYKFPKVSAGDKLVPPATQSSLKFRDFLELYLRSF